MDMAMVMPQTPKAQANVASAQKTANNEVAPKPVTFNTASNTTNNVQEKTAPAVQPQTTETVNNEAAVKPQQPVASQSVAQGSAKTISTPSANKQNASIEKTVTEKQTVAQPQAKSNVQQNNFATTSQTAKTTLKETLADTNNAASNQSNNDLPINKAGFKLQLTGPKNNQTGVLSCNGQNLQTFNNISNVSTNGDTVSLLYDNESYVAKIKITTSSEGSAANVVKLPTKKELVMNHNNSDYYLGNGQANVKDTDPISSVTVVGKDSSGFFLETEHFDEGYTQYDFSDGKVASQGLGVPKVDPIPVDSCSTTTSGADVVIKEKNGQQVILNNNWLFQDKNTGSSTSSKSASNTANKNNSNSANKPASNTANNKDNNGSNTSKPATGTATNKPATGSNTNPSKSNGSASTGANKPTNSNTNGSTNNKPNSTTKPAGTTGNTANGSTNKPADSSTSDTNKPSASSDTNSNKPTNGSTSVNANKPATGSSISGNKPAANSNSNGNNSSAGSSTTNGNKPANGSTSSNTSADKPVSGSSTANAKPSTSSNGSSSSQSANGSTSTSANKPANTSSSSAEQPIKVTVHYIGQDGKIVGTVVDTIQPGSTLDVSKNVPKGYEVSSAFKPQTGVQADNDQATLNVPVVPVGQNGKASQANDKSSANNTPNNGKKNAAQASNTQKSNDKQKTTNGIQAQEKGNTQSLNVNSDRNASEGVARQNVSANSNPVPTFNVAGNASQAVSIAQATGNGQGGVQASASASVVQSNQASSASPSNSGSSANALPETGMSNEGVAFAAAMLALAGFTMIKHEHEE